MGWSLYFYQKLTMDYNKFVILFLFLNVLKKADCQSHAFIQVDNELKYLVDGVPVLMNGIHHPGESEEGFDNIYDERMITKNYLVFDPPFLDFKEHPTGMPLMKKVYVQNTSPDVSIHLHSLSGNTMHFHCTFFQDKVISPGSNTSFDVVFLGREEGFIENTIYVHTSIGTYRYWVKAVGISNPYRVRPLIGVRMPLNSSYTPTLEVHNPHNRILQITEMYSTGGDLHLELSDSREDGEKQQWNIAPYQTKTLMRATFVARRENNHTAYIRIVPKSPVSDYMVVPIEVEVSGDEGLFFPSDTLHFGLLTPRDSPVSLPLYLLNSAPKHIHIQNIISSTVNEAVSIDFKPFKIPPGTVHPVQVATVTFDPSKVSNGVKVSGKLLIKSKVSAYKLSIPFHVDLHQGSLIYNSSVTRFYSGSDLSNNTMNMEESNDISASIVESESFTVYTRTIPLTQPSPPKNIEEPHDLILKNTFLFPVVVYNITVPHEVTPLFKVTWNGPIIIAQDESEKVAELQLLTAGSDIRQTMEITIHTNVTSIIIPLVAYNGKLTKYVPPSGKDSWLDFGTLGMNEQHDNYFFILNENPVDIRLKDWGSTLEQSSVELMGIAEGNLTDINRNPNKTDLCKSLFLKPNHYAAFRIRILTPESEGIFIAESYVQTEYEVITLPFRLRTADGILTIFPNILVFDNAFPGKVSEQDIHIMSTFGHSMTVESISTEPIDRRFTYSTPESCNPSPVLHPGVRSHIGSVIFNPSDPEYSYTGFSLHSKVGQQWASTFPLSTHAVDFDSSLLSARRQAYMRLPARSFNLSLLLDTSEVKGYQFDAKINMVWPHLVPVKQLEFPLTMVHNESVLEFQLMNPASEAVITQILFLHNYPSPVSIFPILQEHLNLDKNITLDETTNAESVAFSFLKILTDNSESSDLGKLLAKSRRSLETEFKTRVAKDSLVLQLEPHSKKTIGLSFSPTKEKTYRSLLMIRNNLTVVEAVLLEGKGGRGHITFRDIKDSPSLQFNVDEKIIKNCSKWTSDSVYTMRQTLVAENEGLLPVHVYSVTIGGLPCESYGFRVLNCNGFSLHPNESRILEIAFTPDFSLLQVDQLLTMTTSNGSLSLSLSATISTVAIAKCGGKVPRPHWEPLLYYSLATVSVAMLIGILTWAILEAEHVLGSSFVTMTTVVPINEPVPAFDKTKVFDLRAISAQDSPNGDSTSESSEPSKSVVGSLKNNLTANNNHHSLANKKPVSNNINAKCKSKCDNKTTLNRKSLHNEYGLTSFLSSLPFALKGGQKTKTKKISPKEVEPKTNKPTSEEEISSTTTESSTSTDDICVFIKDNNLNSYEEKARKRKNSKSNFSNGFTDNCFPVKQTSHQNLFIETGFEITSKCKSIRKIKETTSKRHSNTIELPYTLKPIKNSYSEEERNSKLKHKKYIEKLSTITSPRESNKSPERRAPVKAVIAPSTRPPPINQPLAPRDPSYSSILLGNTKQKCAPVGKILPEVKPMMKPLGPIGQKIVSPHVYAPPLKPVSSPPPQPPPPFGSSDLYNAPVSGHSWDPKTLSAPMSEDDWLPPLGGPHSHFSMWSDTDHALTTPTSSQPSPSLWDSLPSFSIWSSPWQADPMRSWPNEPSFDSSFYDSLRPPNKKDQEHP